MSTHATQAGPSRRSQTPDGGSNVRQSPSLSSRLARAPLRDVLSEEDDQEGSEFDSEDEEERTPVKGKGVAGSPRMWSQAQSTRSYSSTRERSSTSWADLDLSIIVACVSPIGNWLTGGDHIKNLFLIILLIFYLHQLVEVPWKLYQASRPRTPACPRTGEPTPTAQLAATALHTQELLLLAFTAVTPLLGAYFLKYVLTALGEADSLSWFSTTLFVLATGIRPWTHLVSRIKARTEALHDTVHYPPVPVHERDLEGNVTLPAHEVTKRLESLEREMQKLRERAALAGHLQEVCDDLSEAFSQLERGGRRSERKADAARVALAARLALLEKGLVQVEQNRRMDVDALRRNAAAGPPSYYARAWACVALVAAKVLRMPRIVWALGASDDEFMKYVGGGRRAGAPVQQAASQSHGILLNANGLHENGRVVSNGSPGLATIPEVPYADGEADADADSDGTYVSDEETRGELTGLPADDITTTSPNTQRHKTTSTSRSRSRSGSGGNSKRQQVTTPGLQRRAFECAQGVVLWPYRASARILVALVPPLKTVVPGIHF